MQTRYLAIPLAGVLALSSATVANAANKFWKNSVGSGNWSTGNNWSAASAAGGDDGGVPIATNTVRVSPTDGLARTVTYDYVGAPVTLESLRVDLTGAGTARTTFEMSANNLSAGSVIVGDFGRATFNQSGGTVAVNDPSLDAVVGFNAGGDGIYNLSNTGVLSVARDLYVGVFGPNGPTPGSVGVFNQAGSSMNTVAGSLILGSVAGSTGSYSISNTASLTAANGLVGSLGMGTLDINDQASVYFNNTLSINNQSNVNLNGGTLRFDTIGGTGGLSRINYTAGTIQLAGSRNFGSDATIAALFGATPTIPDGKSLVIEGDAYIGGPQTTRVNGGSLSVLTLPTSLYVGWAGGDGVLEITDGGLLEARSIGIGFYGNGAVTVSGAGSTFDVGVIMDVTNSGELNVRDGGMVHVEDSAALSLSGAGSELNVHDGGMVYFEDSANLKLHSANFVNLDGGTIRLGTYIRGGIFNFISGTIQLAGNRSIGSDADIIDFFGAEPTLTPGKGLTVEGTATLIETVTIDGGTFSAGQLANASLLDFRRGTFNLTNQALTIGTGGLFGSSLDVGEDKTVNVTLGITNQGLVTGDGEIGGTFANAAAGELRANPGKSLTLTGTGNTNAGQIRLLGGSLDFQADLTNNVGAFISGNGSLLTGGLTNNGTMNFAGTANIVGDVTNSVGGKIISGGGGATIFYDDVVNNGEIRTSTNGFTVFFGDVSGGGTFTGTGTVNFEGDLSPGNSPAVVSFAGDVVLGPEAVLNIELGGTTLGTYDRIQVTGDLVLDGLLDVSILPGFTPGSGQSFDILNWGTLDGEFFDVNLPTLAGLTWNTSQLYTTGVLSLAAAGLLGDYNNNGTIDAADYSVWRDALTAGSTSLTNDPTPGTVDESDFTYWRAHFGESLGSGAGSAAAAPEPATAFLAGSVLLLGLFSGVLRMPRL